MKLLNIKKVNRINTPVTKTSKALPPGTVTRGVGKDTNVITRENGDRYASFVGKRVSRGGILKAIIGSQIPKLDQHGVLLVHGEKGLLARSVRYDAAKDFYTYHDVGVNKWLTGRVSALNKTDNKAFGAEIVTTAELLKRAKKFGQCKQAKHVESGKHVKVFLLNSIADDLIVGVTKTKEGKVITLNMEHPTQHNEPRDQYREFKDVKEDFDQFFHGAK